MTKVGRMMLTNRLLIPERFEGTLYFKTTSKRHPKKAKDSKMFFL